MTLRKQLLLDADDDLDLSTGSLQIVDGVTALTQRVRTRLQTFLGEVEFDSSVGVPYFQQVFQDKNPKISVLNVSFLGSSALGRLDGIDRVLRLEYDLNTSTRALSVDLRIQAETGEEANTVLTIGV